MIRTAEFYASQFQDSRADQGEVYRSARIEADRAGLTFEWSDDWDGDHSYVDQKEFEGYTIDTCEVLDVTDEHGCVRASLGCVDNATDDYRDVVEAELAIEALADIEAAAMDAWRRSAARADRRYAYVPAVSLSKSA